MFGAGPDSTPKLNFCQREARRLSVKSSPGLANVDQSDHFGKLILPVRFRMPLQPDSWENWFSTSLMQTYSNAFTKVPVKTTIE
jgi:hypothetical protein